MSSNNAIASSVTEVDNMSQDLHGNSSLLCSTNVISPSKLVQRSQVMKGCPDERSLLMRDSFHSLVRDQTASMHHSEGVGYSAGNDRREHCCGVNKLAETTMKLKRERSHTGSKAAYIDVVPSSQGSERRRDKAKKFMVEKGPRVAGAAAAIGMFIFNVVSSCT
jgi:hypothetical protein